MMRHGLVAQQHFPATPTPQKLYRKIFQRSLRRRVGPAKPVVTGIDRVLSLPNDGNLRHNGCSVKHVSELTQPLLIKHIEAQQGKGMPCDN
jgi:hypothetical protein